LTILGGLDNEKSFVIRPADQFTSNRRGTKSAKIFVFVPIGEHEEKALTYWDSALTLRTKQLGGIKLLKGFLLGRACGRKGISSIEESALHSRVV
jgi:hypothetical protein